MHAVAESGKKDSLLPKGDAKQLVSGDVGNSSKLSSQLSEQQWTVAHSSHASTPLHGCLHVLQLISHAYAGPD